MIPVFDAAATPLARGTTLIEASAGTGKTYTITALYLRLLLEGGLQVRQILATTYTEAATAELRERIRLRLTGALEAFQAGVSEDPLLQALIGRHDKDVALARLERALRDFDQAAIHTIHGFCQRMLREHALEGGLLFDAELLTDQSPLLRELVDDFWRIHFASAPAVLGAIALDAKVSPDRLLELLESTIPRPLLRVLPELERDAFDRLKSRILSLHENLCDVWLREGSEIRAMLLGPPKWAGGNYSLGKRAQLECFFASLDACLRAEGAWVEDFAALAKLGQSQLEKAKLKGAAAPAHRFFELCEEYTSLHLQFATCTLVYFLQWAREELTSRKIARNVLCFDDLLTRLHAALHGSSGDILVAALREHYHAALIDEFQDTDGIQEAIFRRIFFDADGWLYFIGDPKQAIYGFRGADVFTYLKAAHSAQKRYTLLTNRRSAGKLVRAVNHLFGRSPGAFIVDGIDFLEVDAAGERDKARLNFGGSERVPLQLWAWDNPEPIRSFEALRELPLATAAAIAKLLAENPRIGDQHVRPSQIAVLVSQHRQARAVQEALNAYQVPSVLISDESVWKSREASELQTILAAVASPAKEGRVRAALATEILGATVSDLERLGQTDTEWDTVMLRFERYHERWLHYGFIQMFRALLLGERVRFRLLDYPDGDRRLTNLLHLAELLQQASSERRLSPVALIRWCEAQRAAATSRGDESMLRLERDDDAVQIITMHRSKGLEFEIVFCPFAWGETARKRARKLLVFHDPADSNRLTLDLGSDRTDELRALVATEQLAEEVRLLYVALTRAIHQCHLVWGRFRECEVSAAAWLLHRPPGSNGESVGSLATHMGSLTPEDFSRDLAQLADAVPESVEVLPLPASDDAPVYHAQAGEPNATSSPRKFRGYIDRRWMVSSFSSLVAGHEFEEADHDRATSSESDELENISRNSIAGLPTGRRTGYCIHKIFEQLDYQNRAAIEPLATRHLTAYSLDALTWTSPVAECVRKVLTYPTKHGFSLDQIPPEARLTELEFHLPAARIEARVLREILDDENAALHFEPRRGWLKGFVDLVVEHEGRFYIIDWKTNRLGATTASYSPEAMSATMIQQHYTLQLSLYATALHRYLQNRLPGYDYEQHFGGAMYYFVRGIDPADHSLGVHYERPLHLTIEKLSKWLDGNL